MNWRIFLTLAFLGLPSVFPAAATPQAMPMSQPEPSVEEVLLAQARSCKAVRSCEEAVILWCNGYRRADGDNDGIPCENVCHSKEQVDRIREQIGC